MRTAKLYATLAKGKVAALNDATPEHPLGKNQIALTLSEYRFLNSLPTHASGLDLDDAIKIINDINRKIQETGNA